MVERVGEARAGADVVGIGRRGPAAHDVVGTLTELEQPGPDDVRAGLDDRHLHGEAVRQADVVGVHAGDDVVAAGGQPGVERGAEADVALELHDVHRDRARRGQVRDAVGERRGDRTVADDDDVVRRAGLVDHGRAERRGEVLGPVAPPHRKQQRQPFAHVDSPS